MSTITQQASYEVKWQSGITAYPISVTANYRGCGRAWAALSPEGIVVALRYMGAWRHTPQTPTFAEYRTQCRAELENLGTLISGNASCCEFIA